MPRPLPAALRHRIVKLLPLLASDKIGEVASTAAAMIRILKAEGGYDLHDAAYDWLQMEKEPVAASQPPQRAKSWQAPPKRSYDAIPSETVLGIIRAIRSRMPNLSGNARTFLYDMEEKALLFDIVFFTERQWAYLTGLAEKASVEV